MHLLAHRGTERNGPLQRAVFSAWFTVPPISAASLKRTAKPPFVGSNPTRASTISCVFSAIYCILVGICT